MNLQQSYHNPMLNELPNLETARSFLNAIIPTGSIFEIRILNARRGGPNNLWASTYSGFFNNIEVALDCIGRFTGADAAGVYVTINPLKEYVLNWNHNAIAKSVASASDDDVEVVQSLFLDIDPVRPRLTCATAKEQQAAKQCGTEICRYLAKEFGFPMPLWAGSSGSGATAIWRTESVTSDLIERCLAALADQFTDDLIQVDSAVHNPARSARVAGTINAKSPTPQPDRPWRHATGRAFDSRPVTIDQLEALASVAPECAHSETPKIATPWNGGSYDLKLILDQAGIQYAEKSKGYGTVYELRQCLTSDQHDTGASLIQMNSGAVTYQCFHNSCSGKGWHDVKARLGVPASAKPAAGRSSHRTTFTPIKIGSNGRVAS